MLRTTDQQSPARARGISRRQAVRLGATGAGLAGAFMLACGSDSNKSSGTSTDSSARAQPTARITESTVTAKVGGTWRVFGDKVDEPNDPTISANTAASYWLYIGDRAIDVNPTTADLMPSLVEKWEQPAPDQIVLKLRAAKWHDIAPVSGRAVTAEDIATALLAHAGKLDKTGGKAIYPRKGNFAGMDTVTASDASTVVIKMASPNNAILPGIADWRLPMFPKEQLDIGFLDSNKMIGSGPWMAVPGYADGTDFGGAYNLTRNPTYWDSGRPYLEKIESTPNQDQAARTNAFLAGRIESLATFRSPKVEIDALIARKADAQFISWKFGHWHFTRFNTQKAPWKDARVRRAVFLALNHAALGDGFYGRDNWQYTGPLVYTFFKQAISSDEIAKMPGWNTATKDQDITTAKQLMSAAGYPEGEIAVSDLVFSLPMNTANSTRLKEQLEKVWPKMKVTIDGKGDSATFYAQTAKLEYDLQCASIYPVPDPVTELIGSYSTSGGRNYGKYANAELDAKLAAALTEFNADQLKSKLLEVQKILIEEMPAMTHYAANLSALYQPKVRGLKDAVGPGVSSAAIKLLSLEA